MEYVSEWSSANGTQCVLTIPDHLGTHMDAPIHSVEGGADLSGVDISRLFGEAVCLDLFKGDTDYGYTAKDFANAEPAIQAGDIVLIYSGWQDVEPDARIRQTYLTPEGAEWLVNCGVHAVGCEPAGIEHVPDGLFTYEWYDKNTANLPSWPAHQVLLKSDVYIIEGLVNLEQIKGPTRQVCRAPTQRSAPERLPDPRRCVDRSLNETLTRTGRAGRAPASPVAGSRPVSPARRRSSQ